MRDARALPPTALFDQIFRRLVDPLPAEPLAALSEALATIGTAPKETVTFLAHHGEAEVAGPMLSESPFLTLSDLAAVASRGSEDHLLAICARPRIDERLSAILIGRAMQPVINRLLTNPGAQFALEDFCAALPRATADSRGRVPLRQPAAHSRYRGIAGRPLRDARYLAGWHQIAGRSRRSLGRNLYDRTFLDRAHPVALPDSVAAVVDCRNAVHDAAGGSAFAGSGAALAQP